MFRSETDQGGWFLLSGIAVTRIAGLCESAHLVCLVKNLVATKSEDEGFAGLMLIIMFMFIGELVSAQ